MAFHPVSGGTTNNVRVKVGGVITIGPSKSTNTVVPQTDTSAPAQSLQVNNLGDGSAVYAGKAYNGIDLAFKTLIGANGITITEDSNKLYITGSTAAGSGTVTSVSGGTGLTGTVTTNGSISLANTTVTPGTYTYATVTVDQQGRITSASSGASSSGVTSVTAGTGLTGGTITSTGTISLPTVNSTVGTYANATVTVDGLGRVTRAVAGTSGGASTLSTLSDVTLTSLSANQLLTYNGTSWVNGSTALSRLSDVTLTSPANGHVVTFNGTRWVNQAPVGGSSAARYTFTVIFSGTAPGSFSNVPNGWTVTTPSTGIVQIVHNVGSQPTNVVAYGLTSDNSTYTSRIVGTGSFNLTYVTSSATSTTTMNNVSTNTTGGVASAIIVLTF